MERRGSERSEAGIAVEFDTAAEPGHGGVLLDLSTTGGLLLSRVEHQADDALTVRFRPAGPSSELVEVGASVVRSEPHDAESIWPIRTALQFEREVALNRDALKY